MKTIMRSVIPLAAALLSSCSSPRHIEIRTVAVGRGSSYLETTEQVIAASRSKYAIKHSMRVPLSSDGVFQAAKQKKVTYVCEYAPGDIPVAKESRQVGLKVSGKVTEVAHQKQTIELDITQADHLGFNTFASRRIKQPVFHSVSLNTSRVVPDSGWQFIVQPSQPSSEAYTHYVIARTN